MNDICDYILEDAFYCKSILHYILLKTNIDPLYTKKCESQLAHFPLIYPSELEITPFVNCFINEFSNQIIDLHTI